MPAKFSPAPEVEAIAAPLIREHHSHLLANAVRVAYCFVDKAPSSGGKTRWGQARKKSGLDAYLYFSQECGGDAEEFEAEEFEYADFFVMIISKDIWVRLRPPQKRALVDHELAHLWSEPEEKDGELTGKVLLSILPHDLEEFNEIVRRHGAWESDIEAFLAASEAGPQLALPEMPAEPAFGLPEPAQERRPSARATMTVTLSGKDGERLGETLGRAH